MWNFGWASRVESTPDAEDQADGSAETEDASDEEREAIARVGEHCRRGVMEQQMARAVGKDDPREKCKAESPNETSPGAGGTAGEENTKDDSEDRTGDQRFREGLMESGGFESATGGADDDADGAQNE